MTGYGLYFKVSYTLHLTTEPILPFDYTPIMGVSNTMGIFRTINTYPLYTPLAF